jgi:hypothetical protein
VIGTEPGALNSRGAAQHKRLVHGSFTRFLAPSRGGAVEMTPDEAGLSVALVAIAQSKVECLDLPLRKEPKWFRIEPTAPVTAAASAPQQGTGFTRSTRAASARTMAATLTTGPPRVSVPTDATPGVCDAPR